MAEKQLQSSATAELRLFSQVDQFSLEFGKIARHVYSAWRPSFAGFSKAYEQRNYTSCASMLDDLASNDQIIGIGNAVTSAVEKIQSIKEFISQRLGPLLKIVGGLTLVALGAVTGPVTGTVIAALLVLVGILATLSGAYGLVNSVQGS